MKPKLTRTAAACLLAALHILQPGNAKGTEYEQTFNTTLPGPKWSVPVQPTSGPLVVPNGYQATMQLDHTENSAIIKIVFKVTGQTRDWTTPAPSPDSHNAAAIGIVDGTPAPPAGLVFVRKRGWTPGSSPVDVISAVPLAGWDGTGLIPQTPFSQGACFPFLVQPFTYANSVANLPPPSLATQLESGPVMPGAVPGFLSEANCAPSATNTELILRLSRVDDPPALKVAQFGRMGPSGDTRNVNLGVEQVFQGSLPKLVLCGPLTVESVAVVSWDEATGPDTSGAVFSNLALGEKELLGLAAAPDGDHDGIPQFEPREWRDTWIQESGLAY
ncbi:MAG TPA: hypothetical protein VHM91_23645, partial [Verrucomicrobiales bacterium]|nr:hypothetical protein [Verrucomicrobiales bacterium]